MAPPSTWVAEGADGAEQGPTEIASHTVESAAIPCGGCPELDTYAGSAACAGAGDAR